MTAHSLPPLAGRVLVVGDVMEDIIVVAEGDMVPGSDRRAQITVKPGGSGANQAVWLAHFGVEVAFFARVGRADLDGLAAAFTGLGVTPLLCGDDAHPSGRLVTLIGADGERSFFTDRGANLFLSEADLPGDGFDGVGLVVISGYAFFAPGPRAAARRMIARARDLGLPVAIDPASIGFLREVGPTAFLDWTRGAALIFANADEAALLSGQEDREAQIRALGGHYGLAVVKCGADGAVAGTAGGVLSRVRADPVAAVDTTGAGDAFLAGFVAAWGRGAGLDGAMTAGVKAGAEAVQDLGGRPRPS